LFIGEPNTGKSNLLEALAVFSEGIYEDKEALRDVLRFKTPADLFFDHDLTETVKVKTDGADWSLKFRPPRFQGTSLIANTPGVNFGLDPSGDLSIEAVPEPRARVYRFKNLASFAQTSFGTLRAPYGSNLVSLLTTNKRLRRLVGDLFRERGYRLVISTEQNEVVMAKEVDDQLYNFSYPTISETLRRIVFYMAVLETNQNSVLLLDEPEANTFPFYTSYLAERIALDETNQFFLTTHNPYVLGSVVGKTPAKDLAVFVMVMEHFISKLKLVSSEGLSRILDYGSDAFLNLDKIAGA
jgi:hypothetical protein